MRYGIVFDKLTKESVQEAYKVIKKITPTIINGLMYMDFKDVQKHMNLYCYKTFSWKEGDDFLNWGHDPSTFDVIVPLTGVTKLGEL